MAASEYNAMVDMLWGMVWCMAIGWCIGKSIGYLMLAIVQDKHRRKK